MFLLRHARTDCETSPHKKHTAHKTLFFENVFCTYFIHVRIHVIKLTQHNSSALSPERLTDQSTPAMANFHLCNGQSFRYRLSTLFLSSRAVLRSNNSEVCGCSTVSRKANEPLNVATSNLHRL